MIITFNREQAVAIIGHNENARPIRIRQGLESKGYKNIQLFGRGKNLMFVCEMPESSDEQCYYLFKDICINEYGYGKNFDYNKALEVIEFHIDNKEFKSIGDIAQDVGMNVKTIYKHRNKLCGKILKDTQECIKRTYARNTITELSEDITELYEDTIMAAYKNTLSSISVKYPNTRYSEVSLFRNKKNGSFEIFEREKDTFELFKEAMENDGNKYIASYPVWFNLRSNPEMNTYLKQRVFQLILKENGYDYVFFLRLYEITEDLKHDKDLLEIITKAIEYSKTLNKD